MKCENCKDQEECDIYQDWLNTRDCCCPYGEYQKELKNKYPTEEGTVINCETVKKGIEFLSKYNNPLYRDSVGGEEMGE